jgi:hypothetical protein
MNVKIYSAPKTTCTFKWYLPTPLLSAEDEVIVVPAVHMPCTVVHHCTKTQTHLQLVLLIPQVQPPPTQPAIHVTNFQGYLHLLPNEWEWNLFQCQNPASNAHDPLGTILTEDHE